MKWSKYQKDIFNNISEGEGHSIIEACAGSGKTTVLVEGLNHIPPAKSWLMVAFNKKIADEMKKRAPAFGGECKTFHSLGLRSLYSRFPKLRVDQDKTKKILNRLLDKKLWDEKVQLSKTISLCKGYLVEGDEFIDYIMDNHDIDTLSLERDVFIDLVKKAIELCKKDTRSVDFDDMIFLPHVYQTQLQKYNYVFIDECQDLNNAQVKLALRSCKRNGRIFAVGDTNQAIYSWRGASSNAMNKLKDKLNAKSLPLSITYRCPLLIVKEAQKLVSTIKARPGAPNGIVDTITNAQLMKQAKPGCFILSRTNAPMIGIALSFIKKGIPASIQGRDIGVNLLNLIKKSRRKTLDGFLKWLDTWEKKEVDRLQKKRRKTDSVRDKAGCIRAISDSSTDLNMVKQTIKNLFEDTDDKDRIILSSCHKSKGLERDTVFMLMSTFKGANQEELNIRYVAITRAKTALYYVT